MWQSTSVLSRAVALRFSLSWFTFSIALGIISVLMGGIPMPICFAVITSLMTVAALATIPPEYAGADLPAALQARIIRLARTVRLIPGLEAFFMYKRWQHQADPASYETFVALVCHTCHFLGIIWITEVMARRGLTIWQGIRGSFLVAICTNASGAAFVYARGGTTFPHSGTGRHLNPRRVAQLLRLCSGPVCADFISHAHLYARPVDCSAAQQHPQRANRE